MKNGKIVTISKVSVQKHSQHSQQQSSSYQSTLRDVDVED